MRNNDLIIRNIDDFKLVAMTEFAPSKQPLLDNADMFLFKALFNHNVSIRVRYIDSLFYVNLTQNKLYRIAHPTIENEYWPVLGEGNSLVKAIKDLARSFLRPIAGGSISEKIYFVICDTRSDRERIYAYEPENFLVVRTDTLQIAA